MIQQNLDLGITGTDLDALSPVDRVIKVFSIYEGVNDAKSVIGL